MFPALLSCSNSKPDINPVSEWQNYEIAVRDGKLSKPDAIIKLAPLISGLSSYTASGFEKTSSSNPPLEKGDKVGFDDDCWAFPLKGYNIRAMDKNAFKPGIRYGHYNTKGYDFFDGNKHGGHPAYDVFIHDKNQDTLDDKTKKPVEALSMTDCLVLSLNTGWTKESVLRGGNYIWLYSAKQNKFFYYAHLKDIFVKPGQFVKKGELIATVGRTGRLAAKKTSPTHVHLMALEYRDGKLLPFDYYQKLK